MLTPCTNFERLNFTRIGGSFFRYLFEKAFVVQLEYLSMCSCGATIVQGLAGAWVTKNNDPIHVGPPPQDCPHCGHRLPFTEVKSK